MPVAILQARTKPPRRSIYDSTRTSNPDTNSISVIISERVFDTSGCCDDVFLARLSRWKTEERLDGKGGKGKEGAVCSRNYWKLNTIAVPPWFSVRERKLTLDEVEVRRNFGDSCVVGNGRRFERKERNGLLFSPDQDGELFIKYIYSNLIFRISRNSSKIEFSSRGFRLISRESEKIKKLKIFLFLRILFIIEFPKNLLRSPIFLHGGEMKRRRRKKGRQELAGGLPVGWVRVSVEG